MTMKALHKARAAPGARYGSVPEPRLKADELLIKVHRASICGSDLPIYHWNSWAPGRVRVPMVFGHEFCGTILEAGPQTRDFQRGDFVSVESHVYCGLCYQCRNGQPHVCRALKNIGVDGPGGFSEYATVPARCAWKHRDSALKDLGSLMEPLGNAVYSVLVEEVAGRSVLVLGCGPQGLFAIAVARASGASPVVAVEGSAFRARLARRLGAQAVVDPSRPDLLGEVLKAGKARDGYDAVLEMSGSPSAIALALKAVKNGGRLTAFGIPSRRVEVDWAGDLIFKGIRLYGIVGREIFQTWYLMDNLLRSGAVDVRPVMTHAFPMKDFKKAFSVLSSPERRCGKVLLVP